MQPLDPICTSCRPQSFRYSLVADLCLGFQSWNERRCILDRQQPQRSRAILAAGSGASTSVSCNLRNNIAKLKGDAITVGIRCSGKLVTRGIDAAIADVIGIHSTPIHSYHSNGIAEFERDTIVVAVAGDVVAGRAGRAVKSGTCFTFIPGARASFALSLAFGCHAFAVDTAGAGGRFLAGIVDAIFVIVTEARHAYTQKRAVQSFAIQLQFQCA